MSLVPLIKAAQDYLFWEIAAAVVGLIGRHMFKRVFNSGEPSQASWNASMFLTPTGWQTDKWQVP